MKWDIDGDFGKYFNDPSLKIPDAHLNKVCKRSKGPCACRYIALVMQHGFVCVKNTPLKEHVDLEANNNPLWKAKGNNCDGFNPNYAQKEQEGSEEPIAKEEGNKEDYAPPKEG